MSSCKSSSLPLLLLLLAAASSSPSGLVSAAPNAENAISTFGFEELQVFSRLNVNSHYLIERGWLVSKIKDVIGNIKEKFSAFRVWINDRFKELLEVAKPHAEIMKQMALEFIKEMTKSAVESVLKAGYEYFREHEMEIGEQLWRIIEALYRKYIEGNLSRAPQIEDFSVEKFDRLVLDGCSPEYLLTEGLFLQSIKDIINSIKDKFSSFKSWMAKQLENVWDTVQPHVDTLKEMAIVFLKEFAKITAEAVIQAGYEFFRERQSEIGEALWKLVEAAYRKFLEGKLQDFKRLRAD